MENQITLVIIKPDAIQRGLVGLTYSRLESLNLEVLAAKAVIVNDALAKTHYQHLKDKPFFKDLIDHLTGRLHNTRYVLVFVFWGPNAIERVREVTGATHPEKAHPRTIRGAFGRMTAAGIMENILHASASTAEAEQEIALWFEPDELLAPPQEKIGKTA